VSNTPSPVDVPRSIHGTNSSPKAETYTPQRALELFNVYAKEDDKSVMETEGFERLCTDANVAFEGALPLILSWQMGSKEMGKITRDEWVKWTSSLRYVLCCHSCLRVLMVCNRISSLPLLLLAVTELEDLLFRGCAPVKPTGKKNDYDRSAYNTYARDVKAGFHKLYMFCYLLAKPE
jgi:DCN1-like protein 4/5